MTEQCSLGSAVALIKSACTPGGTFYVSCANDVVTRIQKVCATTEVAHEALDLVRAIFEEKFEDCEEERKKRSVFDRLNRLQEAVSARFIGDATRYKSLA